MAQIIARYMLPDPGRFLAISQMYYDADGLVTGWRTVASANRNQSYDADTLIQVNWDQLPAEIRRSVEDGEAQAIYNTARTLGQAFSPDLMAFFEASRTQSVLAVPVMSASRAIALLTVFNRAAGVFSP